jgi:hypothetical protein
MPIQRGVDSKGNFYRWGSEGKKYHYIVKNAESRAQAKKRAEKQGAAVHASINEAITTEKKVKLKK